MLLIDGGGSMRRCPIDSEIATTAAEMNGRIVCYGCVREVDILEDLDIGIQALAAFRWATARISGKPICRSTSAASPSCRMTTSMPDTIRVDPLPDALDIE